MVEVFIINIPKMYEANDTMSAIKHNYPDLILSFDIENAGSNYPCGYSILRAEEKEINYENIIAMVY